MNNDILVRKAKIEDLRDVLDIFYNSIKIMDEKQIFQWDEEYPNEDILKEDIQKDQMYIGEIDGKTVSVFVINQECEEEYEKGDWKCKTGTFAVIHRLCVNPIFQNMGIGTKTVHIIENILKERGFESIRLDAFSLNPYAIKMYEKLGYTNVGKIEWRKGLFYLYERKL